MPSRRTRLALSIVASAVLFSAAASAQPYAPGPQPQPYPYPYPYPPPPQYPQQPYPPPQYPPPQYPQQPYPPPPPPPQPPPSDDHNKDGWPGVVGVRVSGLSVKGSDHDGATTAATFTLLADLHQTKDNISWHGSFIGGLGGGTAGLEGGLGFGLAGGLRANLGETHGPFARVGAMGEFWGNDRFYFSRLELPMGELGYQYLSLDDQTLVELGGRASPILGGRYDVGDNARRETSGSYEWGVYVALHTHYGRLDVAYNRIELPTHALDTPIDTIRGDACATVAKHIGVCLDGHFLRGDVTLPSGMTSTATTIYGGVTVGYADW